MAKLTKQDVPFTQVANEVADSRDLSWRAKGIYLYLHSKPDGWNFSADRIKGDSKQTVDKNGKARTGGRGEVLEALKELETIGYLQRKKRGDGRVEYFLSNTIQSRVTELRVADPKSSESTVESLHSAVTRPISNKDLNNNKEGESNNKSFDVFWLAYPKKELKKKSAELWESKNLDSELDKILAFIEKAKETDRWRRGFIKQPPVFLRNECWNDDLAAYGGTSSSTPDNALNQGSSYRRGALERVSAKTIKA